MINYSCPNHLEDYVHRVGRTGRAGRKGTAYTFISAEEEKHAPTLVKALTQAKQKVCSFPGGFGLFWWFWRYTKLKLARFWRFVLAILVVMGDFW